MRGQTAAAAAAAAAHSAAAAAAASDAAARGSPSEDREIGFRLGWQGTNSVRAPLGRVRLRPARLCYAWAGFLACVCDSRGKRVCVTAHVGS